SLAIVSARSKGSPRQKTPAQFRSRKSLPATLQEVPGKRMARATQHPGRELTSKWSRARTAFSETRIRLSGTRPGCNDCRRIAARGYGKIVREYTVPEPETARQKTAPALGDPRNSLR